jgi:hypothetical protein
MTTIPVFDETRLVALFMDPATTTNRWAGRAACIDRPTAADPYFPEDDQVPPADVLACCAGCPVAHECLATALVHEAIDGFRSGWWGGFGPAERQVLWGTLDLPAAQPVAVDLRSPAAIARHLRAQRRTVAAIAAELGCTERTVYRYLAASAA